LVCHEKGITDVEAFENTEYGTQGYTAYDPLNRRIIVAFRGSGNIQNWIENFVFAKTDFACDGCKVHMGFLAAYESL
jgi:hypothetical protein